MCVLEFFAVLVLHFQIYFAGLLNTQGCSLDGLTLLTNKLSSYKARAKHLPNGVDPLHRSKAPVSILHVLSLSAKHSNFCRLTWVKERAV